MGMNAVCQLTSPFAVLRRTPGRSGRYFPPAPRIAGRTNQAGAILCRNPDRTFPAAPYGGTWDTSPPVDNRACCSQRAPPVSKAATAVAIVAQTLAVEYAVVLAPGV